MQSAEYPDLQFIPPRAYGRGRDGYSVQYLVIHHTAGTERNTSAEDGAAYDQRRLDGTSTHYFVDPDSVVQCVYTWDRANACYRYGNRLGIQYELCGTLQTRAQWLDAASDAILTNAARQAARDCAKYNLPARKIGPVEMKAGARGICGHADVTLAYQLGDHTDPGPGFPWDVFLARVQQFLYPPGGDNDMGMVIQKNTPNSAGGIDSFWVWSDGLRFKPLLTWPDVLWHCNLRGQAPGTYTIVDDAEFTRRAGRLDEAVDPTHVEAAKAVAEGG